MSNEEYHNLLLETIRDLREDIGKVDAKVDEIKADFAAYRQSANREQVEVAKIKYATWLKIAAMVIALASGTSGIMNILQGGIQ